MVLLLLSEALGFNGIKVIVFQCLGGFFCSKTALVHRDTILGNKIFRI
jgi:hypothetical protein